MALPKVLTLIIYSPGELYDAQRDFWRRYMNSLCYFITFDNVAEITLDGDTLRIPGIESYEDILLKTLLALDYFLARDSYDFVVRTNISSVWDYPRLLRHLATLPRSGLYYGCPGGTPEGTPGGMRWASGSGMIMTPDICKKLLDARELALSFKIIDDVDIGYTFEKIGVPFLPGRRNDTYNAEAPIPSGFYHQRVRLLPQPENVVEKTISIMEDILLNTSRLRKVYAEKCRTPSDINEHLPVLLEYTKKCASVVECGVREPTSSYAFALGLLGNPANTYTLIDPFESTSMRTFLELCKEEDVNAAFHKGSDLECPLVETDLLFIDTWHIYGHLKRELTRWNSVVKKYIILHDTTVDEIYGETIRNGWNAVQQSAETGIPVEEINRGLGPAVSEFLEWHPEWVLERKLTNNNGLTVLTRQA